MRNLLGNPYALALALVMALTTGATAAEAPSLDARLKALKREAPAQLAKLAATVAECVPRKDTDEEVFRGCIDWHSSVHGTWALLAYTKLAGDNRYWRIAENPMTREGIAAEARKLREQPFFEMPYGRAWFLRLAIADGNRHGQTHVTVMADEVAQSLLDRYKQNGPRPFEFEYANPAWALINLHDYLEYRSRFRSAVPVPGPAALNAFRRPFLNPTAKCSLGEEAKVPQFMSICGNWAALLSIWLPPDEAKTAIDRLVTDIDSARPVTQAINAHHYGLNFSRAWSAWIVYSRTGDRRWAKIFADHMEFMNAHPEWWTFDYGQVGHWVAQFGIFAWERFLTDEVRDS
jgi:hypothetical protein